MHIDGTYDFTEIFLRYSHFVNTVHDRWRYALLVQAKTNALRYILGCEPLLKIEKHIWVAWRRRWTVSISYVRQLMITPK